MNYWLYISSGKGPDECAWVVQKISELIEKEALSMNLKIECLEAIPGDKKQTFKSLLYSLEGKNINPLKESWSGTIQWIGKSKFRPAHKRKNWFIRVDFLMPIQTPAWLQKDLKIETMRSSGAGGQNVNKVESGVRITHIPSKISVIAKEERSQSQNKKLAYIRLDRALKNIEEDAKSTGRSERWRLNEQLERGNPVRIFKGIHFTEV